MERSDYLSTVFKQPISSFMSAVFNYLSPLLSLAFDDRLAASFPYNIGVAFSIHHTAVMLTSQSSALTDLAILVSVG